MFDITIENMNMNMVGRKRKRQMEMSEDIIHVDQKSLHYSEMPPYKKVKGILAINIVNINIGIIVKLIQLNKYIYFFFFRNA